LWFDEIVSWPIIVGKVMSWQKDQLMKSSLTKEPVGEIVSRWNDELMKWWVDEMMSWWNDELMKWWVDEMMSW
jgi:hypothetical protein